MTRDEKLMGAISIALLMAWILGPTIGLDVTAASLLAVAALILTGVLGWEDISAKPRRGTRSSGLPCSDDGDIPG